MEFLSVFRKSKTSVSHFWFSLFVWSERWKCWVWWCNYQAAMRDSNPLSLNNEPRRCSNGASLRNYNKPPRSTAVSISLRQPNDKRRPSSSFNCCLLSATSSVQHLHTKAIIELLTCTTGPVHTFAKLPFCPFAFALIITIKKINGLLNCTRNGLFMVRPTWKPNIS